MTREIPRFRFCQGGITKHQRHQNKYIKWLERW